jgi:glutaminyl-tRNA synthetase
MSRLIVVVMRKAGIVPLRLHRRTVAPLSNGARCCFFTTTIESEATNSNFLRSIIEADLKKNTHGGRVTTRFPPEPNGYLHIGHAKSICLNFGLAADYGGRCHLRFDDTNPTAEDVEFVDSIQEDVRWLGFEWGDHLYFASDKFEQMYELAVGLIKDKKAYVCSLSEEEIREYRGTITKPGQHSPYRERSVEKNLNLFVRMRAGEFKDGEHVLRAKCDMAHANMKMRDPPLYRIRHAYHHRTGDDWCIYPMYDYAHCLEDALEDITHSICTLEFENNRDVYDWVVAESAVATSPRQYEFARLAMTYTLMSKRKLMVLVEEGLVDGWDDPRMPTLAGLRRRGVTPEAIRDFTERIGVSKANSMVETETLDLCTRDDLNTKAPRVMAVLDPLKVVIENYDGGTDWIDADYYPYDVPRDGTRKVPFTREIYIERADFMENPSKKFFRLAPGKEVRLRYGYCVTCTSVVKDEATGEIVELRCSYDPESRGGDPQDGRKIKGTIHWVSATEAIPAEVRLYERLFQVEDPAADERDFRETINPDSLRTVTGWLEPSLASDSAGSHYQFERMGYFISDLQDSAQGKLVFNRVVGMRDSWSKIESKPESKQGRAQETKAKNTKKAASRKGRSNAGAGGKSKDGAAPKVAVVLSAEAELKAEDYTATLGLSRADAEILASDEAVASFFDDACSACAAPTVATAQLISNWVINELLRELKGNGQSVEGLRFGGEKLAELVGLIEEDAISGKIAKTVFAQMLETGEGPRAIVEAKGLQQISDPVELEPVVAKVVVENGKQAGQYRQGNDRMLGFFVGKVMQATQGKANPQAVNKLLLDILSRDSLN